MIPVFSVVAKNSNTGKTTVLCNIIKELKSRGYRVATIKHDVHGFDIDQPEKDTWKHGQAGSDMVMISSPEKFAMIEKVQVEYTLDEILEKINNVDIIITEGYKRENKPKLEVYRKEVADELLCKDEELFGIVTDVELDKDTPQFSFEQIKEVVDLIEKKFLKK
ncbi:molybdopterin-guanine dinucleotide biosynthesis protein B [Alkaliphilus oremlandii]|uniref:Molybdopterin-guanine dinucleotide biosynthesis protein B n=1 Tax=Alkaliphilus oremlandii (strain OhILAs) TaxID=350688 RepID=A8MKV8_ALKOO|nr:molybdopterin-guanine dinucleotide biosynthesis protein B [Alkaliphilus oremlandii]ABW17775.1 molybdopterin-guanine dinucleotide biosynthesis protein B [Alkaliphilus oremlandii OhILAs]